MDVQIVAIGSYDWLYPAFEQFWCIIAPFPPVRLIWILNVDSYFAYDNNNSSTTNRRLFVATIKFMQ